MHIDLVKTILSYDRKNFKYGEMKHHLSYYIDNHEDFNLYGIDVNFINGEWIFSKGGTVLERPLDVFMQNSLNYDCYFEKYINISKALVESDFEQLIHYILIKKKALYFYDFKHDEFQHYKYDSNTEKVLRHQINSKLPWRVELYNDEFYNVSNIHGTYMIYDPFNFISATDRENLKLEKVLQLT